MSRFALAAVLALAALLAGCTAPHTHVSDCAACLGSVIVHDRVSDEAQTQAIFGEVKKALQQLAPKPSASTAPVRSDS